MIFKKKKEEEEIQEDTSEKKQGSTANDAMSADIEKIKARLDAQEELRKVFNEKFTKLDQDIGEYRNMIIERDRDIQTLEIKATKAEDMVQELNPEKIQETITRYETRIEMLKSKIEANAQISERLMEELKDIRGTIKTFRGVDEIGKLTKELINEQTGMKRIQGKIEAHADKTETMYLEIDKKYEEFRHFKDIIENIDQKMEAENKTIKELRNKIENESKRITSETQNLKNQTNKLSTYNDILEELRTLTKKNTEQIQALERKNQGNSETLQKILSTLALIHQKIQNR